MRERPILFSAPMVRAILQGRKTQTRRVLKPQPRLFDINEHGTPCQVGVFQVQGRAYNQLTLGSDKAGVILSEPRLHSVGDTLWVREGWRTLHKWNDLAPSHLPDDQDKIDYLADGGARNPLWAWGKGRPSIHMPRWASRISLKVTGVKVERLHDISEADAIAEGISVAPNDTTAKDAWIDYTGSIVPFMFARDSFGSLWKSINGAQSWQANPWVAVYTFERVKP